jgi:hypothetical protein
MPVGLTEETPQVRLVICAQSHGALTTALRALEIPPHAFLKRGVYLVSSRSDFERIRGLPSYHWCVLAPHTLSDQERSVIAAGSHMRGSELPFMEAIARMLAWRQYHEC